MAESGVVSAPTLSSILSELIERSGIYEAELSRAINLPRATIHRLRTGKISHPKSSTLLLIANYFQVSIDQLLGNVPLESAENLIPTVTNVPLISWNDLNALDISSNNLPTSKSFTTFENTNNLNTKSLLAIKVSNSEAMWPLFEDNSIIIINHEEKPSNRKFVLIRLFKTQQVILRRLLIDGGHRILQPINNSFPLVTMEEGDEILGVVIHVKKNL